MPRFLGRLTHLTGRQPATGRSTSDEALAVGRPIDLDSAPIGPPMLLPALIMRQIVVDAIEFTPVWARPRETTKTEALPSSDLGPDLSVAEAAAPPPKKKGTTRARPRKLAPATADRTTATPKRRPSRRSASNG